jgi:hypothetical protein
MTQHQSHDLIEEALRREGVDRGKWRFSCDLVIENGGMDVRADIELTYLRASNISESFSFVLPRAQGATNAAEQKEGFINSVREKISCFHRG